jgi:hypothetical protein
MQHRSASLAGIAVIVVLGTMGLVQLAPNGFLVLSIAAIVIFEFQKHLDEGVPLLQLTSVFAVLQWLVGPLLSYSSEVTIDRYAMYVGEERYFAFAIPATAFYVAAILFVGSSVRQKNLLREVDRRRFVTIGFLLNIGATIAMFAAGQVSGSLAFLMHLLSQMRYVGAIYFLLSRHQLRYLFAAVSCIQLVTTSLGAGMFHDLVLWMSIIFCYWFAQKQRAFSFKFLMLGVAATILFTIQVIKQEYRQQLRQGQDPSIIELAMAYMTPGGRAWHTDVVSLAITRLNQGWIISAVMSHVPENEPFAKGETIEEAVLGSLAPRFLWEKKVTAGGRENFRRFTGLDILDSTSMAISPLGEAYANFGDSTGIVFMVITGVLFAFFYRLILRFCLTHPTFIFWIPLIFYQAIKAETELSVVINQLTKGAVVAFAGFYFVAQLFPTRFDPSVGIPSNPDAFPDPGREPAVNTRSV